MDASMVYVCDAPVGEFGTAHLQPISRKALEMRAEQRHNWAKDTAEALLPNAQFPPVANVAKVQAAATTVCKRYDRPRKKGAVPASALATERGEPFIASPASPASSVSPASSASPACTCQKCGKTLKTAQGLVGQLPTCNPPSPDAKGDADVKCPKCEKVFKTPEGLTGHLPICNPKSPHPPQPSGRPKKAQKSDVKSSVAAWVVTSAKNNFFSTLMWLVNCHHVMEVVLLFAPLVFAHLSLTCRRVHAWLMGVKEYAKRIMAREYDEIDNDDGVINEDPLGNDDGGWMFHGNPLEVEVDEDDNVEVEVSGLDSGLEVGALDSGLEVRALES